MMQQSQQEPEGSITINKSATLDSIPEDVALIIVEAMKGWVMECKNFLTKEEAIKARDSTLRAIALSCRTNFQLYFPALLESVTINASHLLSIQGLLQRENHGQLVRSLHLGRRDPTGPIETTESLLSNDFLWNEFAAISSLPSSRDHRIRFQQGLTTLLTNIFRSVPAVETLIIESPVYIDGLFLERHTFLTSSLKKLFIANDGTGKEKDNLSAKNALWLLLFVPSLSEAALKVDYAVKDLQVLLEFSDTIDGLSHVSKLSLEINFIWNASRSNTWWGFQEEFYRHSAQENQKTFAVFQLLRCVNTSQLVSLEIISFYEVVRKRDDTMLSTECLTVLHRAFGSLLHLRLFGLAIAARGTSYSNPLSNFKCLKMLTIDDLILRGLHCGGSRFMVPSSLEIVWLPIYNDKKSETVLLQFIEYMSSSLPEMREVGLRTDRLRDENRERLEKAEIFTSGRVRLREVDDGGMMGDPSKPGEVFLSTLRWIGS